MTDEERDENVSDLSQEICMKNIHSEDLIDAAEAINRLSIETFKQLKNSVITEASLDTDSLQNLQEENEDLRQQVTYLNHSLTLKERKIKELEGKLVASESSLTRTESQKNVLNKATQVIHILLP